MGDHSAAETVSDGIKGNCQPEIELGVARRSPNCLVTALSLGIGRKVQVECHLMRLRRGRLALVG